MGAKTVAVLGASENPERYSNKAIRLLLDHHHHVIPITPRLATIEGLSAFKELSQITEPVDTLTLYVGPAISNKLAEQILALKPRRVIFNPGAENAELEAQLTAAGVLAERACTLVLLSTDQF